MAASEAAICNSALSKIGAQRILSLNDNNERSRLMKEQYEKNRDELLYSHPWNFATDRVQLAPLVEKPIYDWDYQFQLPADCLRVYGTDLPKEYPWKVEGRMLMANVNAVSIKYIKQVTDVSQFTPGFSEVLATKIASDVCYSITQSVTLRDQLLREYNDKLRQARSFDAQEGQGDRVYARSWLNARG